MGVSVRFYDHVLAAVMFGAILSQGVVLADAPPSAALVRTQGEPILTVYGQIKHSNDNGVAVFDLGSLAQLGVVAIETTTIWTSGTQTFEGVSMASLLAAVGAKGSAIRATALNDYAIEIPMSDAMDGSALLAFRMNGASLSPRDKGPIWVVYPYDSKKEFQTEVIYSRSIWQLDRIEVLP